MNPDRQQERALIQRLREQAKQRSQQEALRRTVEHIDVRDDYELTDATAYLGEVAA